MYKLLLIWRYLLTRRIALLSVGGVAISVAIMMIVNAIMLGFSREMENRIHGALSDVTISSRSSLRGFDDVDARIRDVYEIAGDLVEAATPTVATPGLLSYEYNHGEVITRQVQIVGIDAASNEKVTAISQYLQHPENRQKLSFDLREDGYDISNPLFGDDGTVRPRLADAGWKKRRADAKYEKYRWQEQQRRREAYAQSRKPDSAPEMDVVDYTRENAVESASVSQGEDPYAAALDNLPTAPSYDEEETIASDDSDPSSLLDATSEEFANSTPSAPSSLIGTPFDGFEAFQTEIDKETMQETGVILGIGTISGMRRKRLNTETGKEEIRESLATIPGADVTLSFLAASTENALPSIVYDRFTIVDLYECHMAEYDDTFVYVPIEKLQELRGMIAPDGTRMATQILIKAKPGVKIEELRDRISASDRFPEQLFDVETWKDQQATTLAAVATELSLLNVVLFLSCGGAGFCILAIFYMIVVDKKRDVGILKSLGAGSYGILQIFLFYALALGLVGIAFGMTLAFWFIAHIQEIADFLSRLMGHEVFDPAIYMFTKVPAIIDPWTVFWIDVGALVVAAAASVFPAITAARLKPVDTLRV
ncbi:MAG: ABC transporter permease [Thermoguttaceae bacterium]|jgi:lipoprotein-releasing system permease protein